MADTIAVVVSGDRQVSEKFDKFPQAAHKRLFSRIETFTDRLAARIRAAVPRLTGRLESEVSELVSDKPEKIVGLVYFRGQGPVDYAKIGALEYGAHGSAKVKAHAMRLDHVFANRLSAPLTVAVEAYSRQMNIAARRFIRDPAASMKAEIEAGLREAVEETVQQDG